MKFLAEQALHTTLASQLLEVWARGAYTSLHWPESF
jgi:hypothetical protein